MTVLTYHVDCRLWERVPLADLITVAPAGGEASSELSPLVARCRGHGGLGSAASTAGLVAMVAARPGAQGGIWVATREGTTVGTVGLRGTLGRDRVRWSIPFLLVVPESRRQGAGTTLVRTALREAAARGATLVAVETLSAWVPAGAFWTSIARSVGP